MGHAATQRDDLGVKELDDASIEMGEGDKLLAEKNRLASAEKINRSLNNAYGQVLGGGK